MDSAYLHGLFQRERDSFLGSNPDETKWMRGVDLFENPLVPLKGEKLTREHYVRAGASCIDAYAARVSLSKTLDEYEKLEKEVEKKNKRILELEAALAQKTEAENTESQTKPALKNKKRAAEAETAAAPRPLKRARKPATKDKPIVDPWLM